MTLYKLKECLNGKSFLRVLQNKEFKNISINGKTIDLGAKNGKASYYRFFNLKYSEIDYDYLSFAKKRYEGSKL